MSLFSSLNYRLTRAASTFHQATLKEPSSDILHEETYSSNRLSLIAENENSTINATSHGGYLNLIFGTGQFFNDLSLTEYLEVESTYKNKNDIQFLNDTYPNADYLLESWWNIFDERYMRHGWGWTITLIIAYMLILVVGVIGNCMVILVVLLRPQMRSVTNMFILNLAVADLFVIVLCVPSTLLANIIAPWILGTFMCKAVAYVQGISVCASAYSLAAISFDRCQAVYRNYERPRGFSLRICVKTVFLIWAAAITITIPWAVVFDVKVSEYDGLRYCVETWDREKDGNIYFLVVNLVCFYVIPLLLIFVSSWIIYCHVTRRAVPQDSSESSAPIRKMHRQTRHDVLRMLFIVTLTFLFSWLPLYILVTRIKFADNISESEYNVLGILMPIAQWLGSWNSSINPILYAFLNKKFRRMFKSILPSWIPIKSVRKYVGSHTFTTTAYTGKSTSNTRSDCHRHPQNGQRNSHCQTNLLLTRFYENTGTVATTSVKIMSSVTSTNLVLISKGIMNTAIADRTTTEYITAL